MMETQPDGAVSLDGAKILVVDDVPKNIQVLGSVLREQGFQVIPATSGAQALKAAETHRPDLILLDVMMPEMSGHEVIQTLRNDPALATIPVIFITALTDNEDEARGLELGAVDYITKPINIPITLSRVRTHLSLQLARRQLEDQNRQLLEAAQLREDVERMSRHDLKTPLSVIVAAPDLILMQTELKPAQADLLKRIKNAGFRMLEMIDRSLDLYKMETGVYPLKPEAVDLVGVIRRILGELERTLAGRSQQASLQIDGAEAPDGSRFMVTGEELLCHSMLSNVLKNAVEASPDGGAIAIALLNSSPRTIRIRNSGEVPELVRDRFFEKYVTAGKERGTGLGTYSAKLIAETQNGSIRLDSSESGYTTIEIRLPAADPA